MDENNGSNIKTEDGYDLGTFNFLKKPAGGYGISLL